MVKTFGIASFVLGIIAIIYGIFMVPFFVTYGSPETWIGPLILCGSIVGIGIVLGIIGAVKDEKITFSIIGLSFSVFALIFLLIPDLIFFLTVELGL